MIDQIKAEIAKIEKKAKSMESATLKNRDGNGHLVAVTQIKLCKKLKKYIKDLQATCPQESDNCEDLEKEAEAYWKTQGGGSHAQWDKFRAVVKHFTEWQKEQNLKDAVEGKVIAGKDGSQYIQTICVDIKESLPNKVKLKIIKEDEKH